MILVGTQSNVRESVAAILRYPGKHGARMGSWSKSGALHAKQGFDALAFNIYASGR